MDMESSALSSDGSSNRLDVVGDAAMGAAGAMGAETKGALGAPSDLATRLMPEEGCAAACLRTICESRSTRWVRSAARPVSAVSVLTTSCAGNAIWGSIV